MGNVCLVLEGGGKRGIYTTGVLDAFLDNNIIINDVYGVSAGALNTMSYLSMQKGRSYRVNKEHMNNKKYINYKRLFLGKAVLNLDYLLKDVNLEIDPLDLEVMEKNKNYIAVSTNIVTGEPVYKKITNYHRDWEYIKASAALPVFADIVKIDGLKLLDGGVSDSIPVMKALSDGYDKIIVILTRDVDFVCKPYSHMNMYKLRYLKYPKFINAMKNRADKYNFTRDKIKELSTEGKALAIYPSEPIIIGHLETDHDKIERIYQLGYNDAMNKIKEIKEMIGEI